MPLSIIVTVKQVPDTHNVTENAMKPDGTVNRAALPTIFNPEDLNALEEALKVKESVEGGAKVTVITMGPNKAIEVLKECLYRGADQAILLTDRKFAGADTLATSYALKMAIEKIGHYDLIFCGRQAIDGDTAQVGPQIAEKLKINQISAITKVLDVHEEKGIKVQRTTEHGDEILHSKFPVLITVCSSANEPRFPSAKKVMIYKNIDVQKHQESYDETYLSQAETGRHIEEWNLDTIKAEVTDCGLHGSPTKVKSIENVVLTTGETKKIANQEKDIQQLVDELVCDHILG